jgi:hypothetical protein
MKFAGAPGGRPAGGPLGRARCTAAGQGQREAALPACPLQPAAACGARRRLARPSRRKAPPPPPGALTRALVEARHVLLRLGQNAAKGQRELDVPPLGGVPGWMGGWVGGVCGWVGAVSGGRGVGTEPLAGKARQGRSSARRPRSRGVPPPQPPPEGRGVVELHADVKGERLGCGVGVGGGAQGFAVSVGAWMGDCRGSSGGRWRGKAGSEQARVQTRAGPGLTGGGVQREGVHLQQRAVQVVKDLGVGGWVVGWGWGGGSRPRPGASSGEAVCDPNRRQRS